ncbi:hypothetical protein NC651_019090 [Populus alba x Populus x berolinensis]|nr:hypothetical protein NC651_019090 [Populus alba x Populus x berolinensis]
MAFVEVVAAGILRIAALCFQWNWYGSTEKWRGVRLRDKPRITSYRVKNIRREVPDSVCTPPPFCSATVARGLALIQSVPCLILDRVIFVPIHYRSIKMEILGCGWSPLWIMNDLSLQAMGRRKSVRRVFSVIGFGSLRFSAEFSK